MDLDFIARGLRSSRCSDLLDLRAVLPHDRVDLGEEVVLALLDEGKKALFFGGVTGKKRIAYGSTSYSKCVARLIL